MTGGEHDLESSGLSEQATVHQAERVAARVVEGQAVVIVIDHKELLKLNRVGTRVWELCDGRTLGAVADQIVKEFRVERTDALRDAARFVQQLVSAGAVRAGGPE